MTDIAALARSLIVCGIRGPELSADEAARLTAAPFAGYILFARNVRTLEQTRRLNDTLRALHDRAPLLCVDQEGGRVVRLQHGVETLPPMRALGETGDEALAERAGEQCAHDVRRAGFNVDFAPVLDVASDGRNTVIGSRAFSSDPSVVAQMGAAFARGLDAGGVVPVFKHFPGHGSTAGDSHALLPEVELDAGAWRARDAVPFAACLPQARAVMTAHVVLRAFDPEHPATLSPAILTALLRNEMHFRGVCFTDCMEMAAVASSSGTVAGVVAAIAAGADCALVSHDLDLAEEAASALAEAVRAGAIPLARLEQAAGRISTLRDTLAQPLPLDDPAPHPGIGRAIARRAVRALRGTPHGDPTADIAVSFEGATEEGAQGEHRQHASLRAEAPALAEVIAPLQPAPSDVEPLVERIASSGRRPLLLTRRAQFFREQSDAVRTLCARFPDAMIVSMREPDDAFAFAREEMARTIVCAFGDDAASVGGLADVLFSRI